MTPTDQLRFKDPKVLLVHPPWDIRERYGRLSEIGPILAPLGLAYIAAVLEENDIDVDIIDAPALGMSFKEFKSEIRRRNPDVVGITCLTPSFYRAVSAAEVVKSVNPEIIIVMGGPHPTVMPEYTLRQSKADIVVIGEGEYTMLELVRGTRSGELKNIRGIAYKNGQEIKSTIPRPYIKDLDELPFPARHLLPMKNYKPAPSYYKRLPVRQMITSRGCPYRCSFCCKPIFGKTYRVRSPKKVVDEIEFLIEKYGAKEVFFRDDSFAINENHVRGICEEITARGIDIEWCCEARVDNVSPRLLNDMKKSGCWLIRYGIESGSQTLLDGIKKDITLEQARKAVEWTKKAGIETHTFFMLALPGETIELSMKTIDFALELDPDYAQFTLTTPYPGTELYVMARKMGTLKSYDWSRYKSWASFVDEDPVFVPKGMTIEQVRRIQKVAIKRFYLRARYILKRIAKIRNSNDLIRYVKSGLTVLFS